MAATKTFEVIALVGAGGMNRATVHMHAVDAVDADKQAKALLVNFRRSWSIRELPAPRAYALPGTLAMLHDSGSITWKGHADTTAPPGCRGILAKVTVHEGGDVRVDIAADDTGLYTAPADAEQEAHVLRATVRAMARELARRSDDGKVE